MSSTAIRSSSRVGSHPENLSFVSFVLGDNNFVINVSDVHGIYHGLSIIPNPDGPSFLEGDVQFGEQRIPVVNLRRFAGMSDCDDCSSGQWILMLHDHNGPVGLVVDRVTEVVKLKPESLKPTPDDLNGPVSDYISAVAEYQGRSMLVPDFNRLLHDIIIT